MFQQVAAFRRTGFRVKSESTLRLLSVARISLGTYKQVAPRWEHTLPSSTNPLRRISAEIVVDVPRSYCNSWTSARCPPSAVLHAQLHRWEQPGCSKRQDSPRREAEIAEALAWGDIRACCPEKWCEEILRINIRELATLPARQIHLRLKLTCPAAFAT